MGTYYTGIIYGINLEDKESKDVDFWYSLYNNYAEIASDNKIPGILTTDVNECPPFIGYAIAYDYKYRAEQDQAGDLTERIIVTPSLQKYCETHFRKYTMIAYSSWGQLITYIQKKYPDREIPEREYFVIEDYD